MSSTNNAGNWRKITRRALIAGSVAVAGIGAVGVGELLSQRGSGVVIPGKSRARRVDSDSELPQKVDVVVIGGGDVGCLTALTLAERGVRVALCEKGVIAGEASGRSLGYVDNQFLDPVKMEIIGRSKQLWAQMNARIGADSGYRRCGAAALFADKDSVAGAEAWLASVRGAPGVDARILDSRESAALTPGSIDRFAGALYQPSDGTAEPQLAASGIAEQIRRLGGIVLQNCAVRGIESSGGRISAAVTEKGAIACGAVVLAGGIWSPIFARSLGLDLPQFMAFGNCARMDTAAGPQTALVLIGRGVVMRQSGNGSVDLCQGTGIVPVTPSTLSHLTRLMPAVKNMWGQLKPALNISTFADFWEMPSRWSMDRASPFEANRIFVPETENDQLDLVVREFTASFPKAAGAPVTERWAGALMSTLDNMPVISAVEKLPGLFIGSGFYYGLTMSPAAGEALADLVMGRKPQIDLSLYRFSRFSDGSPLVFRA